MILGRLLLVPRTLCLEIVRVEGGDGNCWGAHWCCLGCYSVVQPKNLTLGAIAAKAMLS
jgi:hypothetical protein